MEKLKIQSSTVSPEMTDLFLLLKKIESKLDTIEKEVKQIGSHYQPIIK